jgi:hypothetical protein
MPIAISLLTVAYFGLHWASGKIRSKTLGLVISRGIELDTTIVRVLGREILDSGGNPTVEVDVYWKTARRPAASALRNTTCSCASRKNSGMRPCTPGARL